MPQASNRGARAFTWLFIVIGVVAIGCGAWNLLRSLRCAQWPTTEGVIETAKMERHSGGKHGDTYSASISYDYQVAGVHHLGTRLAFGAMSSSPKYAQSILNRYPVGKRVQVHYAPDHPDEAVLETGVHGGTWICFGVGTVFVLFGAMFLGVFSRAESPAPAALATPSRTTGQQPPIIMGVIFVLMGSFAFFMEPANGVPSWIVYLAGGIFVLFGLFVLTLHLKNKLYSKILMWASVLALLVLFHWVSFGPGERVGTATTPFSQRSGVNVKTCFAAFTVLIDVVMLASGARWLIKRGSR
jgi:hypothetical protein